VGQEACKTGEECWMGETPIKAPPVYKKPSLVTRIRSKIARILIDLAYHISWDGYYDSMSDGEFGYCPDCEQRGDPDWRCR